MLPGAQGNQESRTVYGSRDRIPINDRFVGVPIRRQGERGLCSVGKIDLKAEVSSLPRPRDGHRTMRSRHRSLGPLEIAQPGLEKDLGESGRGRFHS